LRFEDLNSTKGRGPSIILLFVAAMAIFPGTAMFPPAALSAEPDSLAALPSTPAFVPT